MPADLSLSEKARRILSQFPGPVTLRPSRLKLGAYFVVMLLVAALGASGLSDAAMRTGTWDIAGAVFLLLVGCTLAVISAVGLLTNYLALTLDAEGLETLYWFRRRRCSWKNVNGFESHSIYVRGFRFNMVEFHDATRPSGFWYSLGNTTNMRVPDTYRLRAAEDLVHLLTAWRKRALAQSH